MTRPTFGQTSINLWWNFYNSILLNSTIYFTILLFCYKETTNKILNTAIRPLLSLKSLDQHDNSLMVMTGW